MQACFCPRVKSKKQKSHYEIASASLRDIVLTVRKQVNHKKYPQLYKMVTITRTVKLQLLQVKGEK